MMWNNNFREQEKIFSSYIKDLVSEMDLYRIMDEVSPINPVENLCEDEIKECLRLYFECMPLHEVWDYMMDSSSIIENMLHAMNIKNSSPDKIQSNYMNLSYSMIDCLVLNKPLLKIINNLLFEEAKFIYHETEEENEELNSQGYSFILDAPF